MGPPTHAGAEAAGIGGNAGSPRIDAVAVEACDDSTAAGVGVERVYGVAAILIVEMACVTPAVSSASAMARPI